MFNRFLLGKQQASGPATNFLLYAWGTDYNFQLGFGTKASVSSPVQIGTLSWSKISAASLAIRSDGYLFGWGDNRYGQLGIGRNDGWTLYSPDTTTWSQVAVFPWNAPGDYIAAIKTDGSLWFWDNPGDVTKSGSPIKIGTSSWSQVSSSGTRIYGITTLGELWTWSNSNSVSFGIGNYDGATQWKPYQILSDSSWAQLAAGPQTVVAIKADGSLWAWGYNQYGEIGVAPSVTQYTSSPVKIGSSSWSQVASTQNSLIAAIKIDGSLWSWGYNNNYVITNAVGATQSSPIQIGTSSWSKISAGTDFLLGLTISGSLQTWGANESAGELGIKSGSPIQIGTSSWSKVAAGDSHSLGIKADGSLWAWGDNIYGQLGDGTSAFKISPVQIGTSSWSQISAKGNTSLAIDINGNLYSWGSNGYGQLGNNDTTLSSKSSPVKIGTTTSWAKVAAGTYHTLAIMAAPNLGALYAWGDNGASELGDILGTTGGTNPLVPVLSGAATWGQVSVGLYHGLAIKTDGSLWAWGTGTSGQLGNGTNSDAAYSPVKIGSSSWSKVAAGMYSSYGITTTGGLYAWGDNTSGILGIGFDTGTISTVNSPIKIGSLSWSQISAGPSHVLALQATTGALYAWGYNLQGQLGLSDAVNRLYPTKVGSSSWSKISAGANHSAGLLITTGALYLWGANDFGQLGDNGAVGIYGTSSPVKLGTVGSWTQIAAGACYTLAIGAGGTTSVLGGLYSWGDNAQGQLGDNSTTSTSSPIKIGASSWTLVGADPGLTGTASFGTLTTGALYSWGYNANGIIGDNTVVSKSSPVKVGGAAFTSSFSLVSATAGMATAISSTGSLYSWGQGFTYGGGYILPRTPAALSPIKIGSSSWTQIAAGNQFSLGIITTGALYGWGYNELGQLGINNTTLYIGSPTKIGTTASWSQISAGANHTLAIGAAATAGGLGSLWAWGLNTAGQMGDSTQTSNSSPVKIGSSSWSIISAGYYSSAGAVITTGALYAWGGIGQTGVTSGIGNEPSSSPVKIGTSSWTQVSVGYQHVLGITASTAFKLFSWGNNQLGQLGNNTRSSSPTPIDTKSWTQISASLNSAYAIDTTGGLWAWGNNTVGQLGQNNITNLSSPAKIGASSWSQVSSKGSHVLGLTFDGKLYSWGDNSLGQLGLNDTTNRSSPVQVGTSSWSYVAAGPDQSFGKLTTGSLYSWGNNAHGETGQATFTTSSSSPAQIASSVSWNIISTDFYTSNQGGPMVFGIDNLNRLYWWGRYNSYGSGLTYSYTTSPIKVDSNSWSKIAASYQITSGITTDGKLYSWGTASGWVPGAVPTQQGTSSWSQISAGYNHFLAIDINGGLYSWGDNTQGQLGLGDTTNRTSPIQIGTSSWSQVSAGYSHSLALDTTKTLWGWGYGGDGQVGAGVASLYSSPVQVAVLPTISWSYISAGGSFSLGVATDGTLYAWGKPTVWGDGPAGTVATSYSPIKVNVSGSWSQVSAGYSRYLAIGTDNRLYSTGSHDVNLHYYRMMSSPVQIGTGKWSEIASNSTSAAGIRQDGSLYTWGYNTVAGILGLGAVLNNMAFGSPVKVGNSSWSKISVGISHMLGLTVNGELYAWGANDLGQLGNNNIFGYSSASPVKIGSSSWTIVSADNTFNSFGITTTGALFGWGANVSGSLGLGDTTYRISPVQIGTSSWSKVSAGVSHTVGITSTGALYAWGDNIYGQLGIGTVNNTSSPVQIGSSSWSQISAGTDHTLGILTNGALYAWGDNSIYNLGIGTTANGYILSPTKIGSSSWTQVATAWNGTVKAMFGITI